MGGARDVAQAARLPAVVLGLWVALLPPASAAAQPAPRAVGGVLDLSMWDFARQGSVGLVGEWQLRTPDGPARPIEQPGMWNRLRGTGLGRARLQLTLLLPGASPPLALAFPDVNSAYQVLLDGEVVGRVGVVADNAAGEVPAYEPLTVPLPAGRSRTDLVLDVSNHHHFEGGVGRAIRLGPAGTVDQARRWQRAMALMLVGALTVLVLVLLAFYAAGRRDPAFLVGAFSASLIAVRAFAAGQLYTLFGSGFRSDLWYLAPSYVTFYALPAMYAVFLRSLVPHDVPRWTVLPFIATSGLMVVLVLVTPPHWYTSFRDPFLAVVFLSALLASAALLVAIVRRRQGAGWLFGGSVVLAATMVHDTLHYERVIRSLDLLPLGFAVFALSFTAALALRLFRSERQARQDLNALNVALEARVADRTEALEAARRAAERAADAKGRFLAMMSHEIRTAMNGIIGSARLLRRDQLTADQTQLTQVIHDSADQMSRVLDDVLDRERMDAGRLEITEQPFDVRDLVQAAARLFEAEMRVRGLALHVEVADDVPAAILSDPVRLRQILHNLMANAVKFTAVGSVRVLVRRDRDRARFEVIDTGAGIPADAQARIFEEYVQAGEAPARPRGGTGLGLAICRRLVRLLGGEIGVESTIGRGSRFWFTLPLREAVLPPAAAAPTPPASPVTPLRVLVVDDLEMNRMVIQGMLSAHGHTVLEAADGPSAIRTAESGVDLVLLDINMPSMDGVAVRAELARVTTAVVAAMTAGVMPDELRRYRETGFDAVLPKPVKPEELAKIVATARRAYAEVSPMGGSAGAP